MCDKNLMVYININLYIKITDKKLYKKCIYKNLMDCYYFSTSLIVDSQILSEILQVLNIT